MALVEKEFSPNSRGALIKFDGIKRRVQNAKVQSENTVVRELQRNHLGLMGGLGLVVFFGLAFLWALAHAVIRPIQNMRAWADRVARGEKGLAMTAFSGKNELTELAQSIGEMAIQLTRPKAYPPPLPEPKAPPKLPAVPVPPVPAPKIPAPETPPVLSPAALRSVIPPPIVPPSPPPAPETALHEWAIPQMPSTSASTVPAQALPDLPPPSPPAKDDLDEAVSEFREILALMGKKEPPKPRRKP
ncbi:MAG: HAMP domain-containing protein [Elusimicrobia bacterium]|nr:HAMP domain-containing protein [Elusimicrobiota bacterium]